MHFIHSVIARFFPQSADDCLCVFNKTVSKLEKLAARKLHSADRFDMKCLELESLAADAAEKAMAADAAADRALEMADRIRNTFSLQA